jgi:hypothetical protein
MQKTEIKKTKYVSWENFASSKPSVVVADLMYQNQNGIYWEQALNCMVELKGTHHFNNCIDIQMIMPTIQDGVLSAEDQNSSIPVLSIEMRSRNQIHWKQNM